MSDPRSKQCYANSFKGLTFWILNKNLQETASLSIVLSLSIHKISSKHDRDTTASKLAEFKLNASHIHYTHHFCKDVRFSFWILFDTQLMNVIRKYVLLYILDFQYEYFKSLFAV